MEDPILKLRQSFIISNKPGYLSEKFDELQLPYSSIFFAEILHTYPTYQCLFFSMIFFKFC